MKQADAIARTVAVFLVAFMVVLSFLAVGAWGDLSRSLAEVQRLEDWSVAELKAQYEQIYTLRAQIRAQSIPDPIVITRDRLVYPEAVVMVDRTGAMCVGTNMHSPNFGMQVYYEFAYCVRGGSQ